MDQDLYSKLKSEFVKTPANLSILGQLIQSIMLKLSTGGIFLSIHNASSEDHNKAALQDVLEMAVYWSAHSKEGAAFERYMAQLFTFYFDPKPNASPRMYPLLGLYLLHLLVSNRSAEFYSLLERISNSSNTLDLSNPYIQFSVQLKQCLVEGTFHRIVLAREQVPAPEYAWFVDSLMGTIRNEVAECLEKSYSELDVNTAASRLLITLEQIPQLITFAQQRGWQVKDNKMLIFYPQPDTPSASQSVISGASPETISVIRQALQYAAELEKIV